jgi:hypothetical protein
MQPNSSSFVPQVPQEEPITCTISHTHSHRDVQQIQQYSHLFGRYQSAEQKILSQAYISVEITTK